MVARTAVAKTVYVQDADAYYNYHNVEDILAEIGATLQGITSLVNWSEASSTDGPNVAVGATSFSALSSLADADACIVPKGNGAVLASVPDATATQGNKRGLNAVDLQLARSAANQVAVNQWSGLVAGRNNRAAGNSSFIGGGNGNVTLDTDTGIIGGRNGSVTGVCSFMGGGGDGAGNTINAVGAGIIGGNAHSSAGANYSFIGGGQGHTLSGVGAGALGGNGFTLSGANSAGFGNGANDNGRRDVVAHGVAQFAANAPAQIVQWGGSAITTNATATAVTADRGVPSATNQFNLRNDTTAMIRGQGVARRNATGDQYNFTFVVSINRGANAAATTVDVATVTDVFKSAGAAAWTIAFTADTTLGGLRVTFTGAAGVTIRCAVFFDAVEVTG